MQGDPAPTDTASTPIRVLIVDDHPVVREGLAALVDRRPDMTVVAQAGNGQEAVRLYGECLPDVTLMDLRLPGMDGVAAITALHEQFDSPAILVLTTYDGDEDIHRALCAGAMGYLLKDAPREELIEAIRTVRAGGRCIPAHIGARLAQRVGNPTLTDREREVLGLLARGRSNYETGVALSITEGTVKQHVNSILSKLGVSDRTHAVTTALKRGIVQLE